MMSTQIEFQNLKGQLLKQIAYLEQDIEDLQTECLYEKQYVLSGTGALRSTLYRRMPVSYVDTAFQIRGPEIAGLVTMTFSPHNLSRIFECMEIRGFTAYDEIIVMCCTGCEQTPLGWILTLEDPYKKLTTYPIKDLPYSKEELRERLLRIRTTIRYQDTCDRLECKILELLPFRLHEYYNSNCMVAPVGWKPFETVHQEYLSGLTEKKSLQENIDEVIRFVNHKKKSGAYGHARRALIFKKGYAMLQNQNSKYVLIPNPESIDVIIYPNETLSDIQKWSYQSFDMEDDIHNALRTDDLRLIQSY